MVKIVMIMRAIALKGDQIPPGSCLWLYKPGSEAANPQADVIACRALNNFQPKDASSGVPKM